MGNHLDLVKKLMKVIENTDISEIAYEEKNIKIKLSRGAVAPVMGLNVPANLSAPAAPFPAEVKQKGNGSGKEGSAATDSHYVAISSPFVGTFYRSPAPSADPFVQEGKEVHPGDVLCIVEAMKLMNEIEADRHARIARILVENGTPVEYGQELFLLELLH